MFCGTSCNIFDNFLSTKIKFGHFLFGPKMTVEFFLVIEFLTFFKETLNEKLGFTHFLF